MTDCACPQCGPDARGGEAHAREHHAWPPGISPAYERLREGAVARTVTVSDDVMVDVDEHDLVLGVETLGGSDWRDALADLARAGRLAVISAVEQAALRDPMARAAILAARAEKAVMRPERGEGS